MRIETERMIIRNFMPEDAADLHEIFGDDDTMKNCEPAYDFEKTQKFLNDFCIGRNGAVAAVHKESGKMIGYILFNELDEGVYEIYVIAEKEHLALLPKSCVRILVTADLDTIKERFAQRMRGNLPAPVAAMLEKKHGCFDAESHDYHVISGETDLDELTETSYGLVPIVWLEPMHPLLSKN